MTSAPPVARRGRALARVKGVDSIARRARRRQIVAVALDLVLEHGYDGLQMRQVADGAKVSTRTLYKHFPSKEHLLLAALVERGEAMEQFLGNGQPAGRSASSRVRQTLATPTQALQAVPALTAAMAKALVSGQESIIPILIEFRDEMVNAIARAIRPVCPTDDDLAIARILQRVWFAALLAWSAGIEPPGSVAAAVDEAIERLLPGRTRHRPPMTAARPS